MRTLTFLAASVVLFSVGASAHTELMIEDGVAYAVGKNSVVPLTAAPSDANILASESTDEALKEEAQSESLLLKLLSGLLAIISPLLVALVTKMVTKLHAEEKNSKLAYAGSVVGDLLLAFVREAEAKLAPQLQAALADGVLDQKERDNLRTSLVTLLKAQAPDAVMKTLQGAFGAGLEVQLHSAAEAAIDHMVAAAPTSPQAATSIQGAISNLLPR